ncbi:hypothetical protein [Pedobacter sp. MR22-3]|uniref:hypothetical protein n=1 Tax=Pedobacter sp. MR22-3 TaxID=2994552 RepID=UPI00224576BD|nr:hypothetical protein [Pedobacter sp. MR22-3]MCX2584532.1 hypothetical protein [Pedobacter sp. MR22-3]
MIRIECLQSKYELARANFIANRENISVTSYYWSIYQNGQVKTSGVPSQATADNPIYILSAYVHQYMHYGLRKDAYIIDYQNTNNESYFSFIPLSNWKLSDIKIFACELISGATFEMINDYRQVFTFYFDSATKFRSMQMLWDFALELDENCQTVKEAEVFYKYYLKKLELEQANFSIEQYEKELSAERDLNVKYQALLQRIEVLISN